MAVCIMSTKRSSRGKFSGTYPILLKKCGVL
ncbi:hypothetical protein T11_12250 [Trichinella zimbabwensis]|uniref:Uncharacterized protein n=1 Tax=Trichinella zimbabwensis TaxID=268475 RepID=A0A0V1G9G4_9BILA|nr:hypothetical protein T11_12250 [Trichinella zimbabwensis]